MSDSQPIRLVVDACVMRSTGEGTPRSTVEPTRGCRAVLLAIVEGTYDAVLSDELRAEWRHQVKSDFARRWQTEMARRGRIARIGRVEHVDLRARIQNATTAPDWWTGAWPIMEKDLHLIEAALATDDRVISVEWESCRQFKRATRAIAEIRRVMWVHPEEPVENAVVWLTAGAPREPHRQLDPSA